MAPLKLDRKTQGVYPISITPFTENGDIDHTSMDKLTDFFLECGVPGVTLLGVLGEVSKLSEQESLDLVQRTVKRIGGRAQVIVGSSHIGMRNFKRFTAAVMDAGAAGIMVAPASGLRTEEHVLNYFDAAIESIGDAVPIVLQDYPQNTGVYLSVGTLGELLKRHASIKVIKHEEGSALRKISRLRAQEGKAGRERVSILVGNSAIYLPQELLRGADGANTGVAFPEMLVEVCRLFAAGDIQTGEDLYDLFLPLVRYEQQPGVGLAIRKEIFRRRGLIACSRVRAPGPSLNNDDHHELGALLGRLQGKLRQYGAESLIAAHPIDHRS